MARKISESAGKICIIPVEAFLIDDEKRHFITTLESKHRTGYCSILAFFIALLLEKPMNSIKLHPMMP